MHSRHQHGFTLLELMASLAIGIIMLVGLASLLDMSLQDTKGQQTALHQAQFTAAATRFLGDNYAALLGTTGGGATVRVTLADLTAPGAGYLPANFAATNAYRQTPCMLVRSPAANQLDALVVTEGGDIIPEKDIDYVIANAGTGAGAISYATPTVVTPVIARGTYGGWQLNNAALTQFTATNCSGTSAGFGNLASALFFGGAGQFGGDTLYRNAVAGQPRLNQMNTPIGMGPGATVVAGTPCGAAAAFAMDANRKLLSCNNSSVWADASASQWKEPVASFAALPGTDLPGDVRMTLDLGRAYTWTGATWQALAIDQNGDMTVPRNLLAQSVTTTGDITAGQDLVALRDIRAGQDIRAVRDIFGGNDIEAPKITGYILTRSAVHIPYNNDYVTPGQACNFPEVQADGVTRTNKPVGTTASDSNGYTLFCSPSGNVMVYQNGTTTPP